MDVYQLGFSCNYWFFLKTLGLVAISDNKVSDYYETDHYSSRTIS
jgi:hypothetical protein